VICECTEGLAEQPRVGIQIHKHRVEPLFATNRDERKNFRVELFDTFDLDRVIE